MQKKSTFLCINKESTGSLFWKFACYNGTGRFFLLCRCMLYCRQNSILEKSLKVYWRLPVWATLAPYGSSGAFVSLLAFNVWGSCLKEKRLFNSKPTILIVTDTACASFGTRAHFYTHEVIKIVWAFCFSQCYNGYLII